jgi:hypothetical protein
MAGPAPADVIEQDDWYLDFLSRRIVDAVLLAEKDRKPSELYFSKGALENFSFCRIYNMEGGGLQTNPFGMNTKTNVQEKHRKVIGPRKKIDTSVTVVEIRQDKKTRGVLVHFTCHCDVVGSETAISADYPGVLRRIIKERFCPETAVLFLQGPCGDINHVDTFHVAETKHAGRHLEIGRALADIALTCLKRGEASESSNIKAAGKDISVPLRKPGADLLAWSENIMKTVPEDARALADFDTKQVDRFFARTYIQWHNDSTKNREVFLQTLKIGDIGIYSSPGELFSEYGDGLMEKSSFKNTIVAAYSNDYAGYIVTPECYADGVYEARQTVFEPEAGSLMNDELLKLGKEINDGY